MAGKGRVFGLGLLLWGLALAPAWALAEASVASPDGRIAVRVFADGGRALYEVRFKGVLVLEPSRLGLEFRSLPNLSQKVAVEAIGEDTVDQRWEQPWGERRQMREHYNELAVALVRKAEPGLRLHVRFRVFDDGIGFRYEMPEQGGVSQVAVMADWSEFVLAERESTEALFINGEMWNRYEHIYQWAPVSAVDTAATPISMRRKDGIHLSIHEAALVDWAGFILVRRGLHGALRAKLAPWSDGVAVKTRLPFKSSWRTVQIADSATGLLNSSLILNLNEPNKLGDVSWVKPGKYTGVWWEMHLQDYTWGSGARHGATTARAKGRIDFAAEHGFDGVLVEGWNQGWDGNWLENGAIFSFTQSYPDFDLAAVAAYGAERGVKLVGHHETSGDVENYRRQMAAAYDLYEEHGVAQVKTGYVAWAQELVRFDERGFKRGEWHDGQYAVGEYLRSVTEAAKRKIAINTHEPVKDTGLRRTYPNWITREGARGQEFNSAPSGVKNPPEHNANLVYTRMLSGPMDFTPGIFDLQYEGRTTTPVASTLMHQLALYVALYSPIQMVPDYPEHYARYPDAFQFIVDVPTDWEESIALAGEMGEYAVFARRVRGGDDWYLGAIGGAEAQAVDIPLSFLDPDARYDAQIYRDGPEAHWRDKPFDYLIEEKKLRAEDRFQARLAPGGGFAVRLVKR